MSDDSKAFNIDLLDMQLTKLRDIFSQLDSLAAYTAEAEPSAHSDVRHAQIKLDSAMRGIRGAMDKLKGVYVIGQY